MVGLSTIEVCYTLFFGILNIVLLYGCEGIYLPRLNLFCCIRFIVLAKVHSKLVSATRVD